MALWRRPPRGLTIFQLSVARAEALACPEGVSTKLVRLRNEPQRHLQAFDALYDQPPQIALGSTDLSRRAPQDFYEGERVETDFLDESAEAPSQRTPLALDMQIATELADESADANQAQPKDVHSVSEPKGDASPRPESESGNDASALEPAGETLRADQLSTSAPQPKPGPPVDLEPEPELVPTELEFDLCTEGSVVSAKASSLHACDEKRPLILACLKAKASPDLVDVSVFGPNAIPAGHEGLIQVFLHRLENKLTVYGLAMEADPNAKRRGVHTLAAEITRGQCVELILEAQGLAVNEAKQTLIWRGQPCACQFTVAAPRASAGRTFHARVIVLVDTVPIGSVSFALGVIKRRASRSKIKICGDRARRYTYAYLCYASQDRHEVIRRAQMLKAAGIDFFNDLLSLEPGENWGVRLYEEIDRCDVFYLFWSSHAKASEWVMIETEYALALRTQSEDSNPDIIPIVIEGPPPPPPPASLRDIHFNDSLIYVLAGVKADIAGSAPAGMSTTEHQANAVES
jgi:TIR domain